MTPLLTRLINALGVVGAVAPQFLTTLIPDPQKRAAVSLIFALMVAMNHEQAVKMEPPTK